MSGTATAPLPPTIRRFGRPVWITAAALLAAVVGLAAWLLVSLSAGSHRVATVDAPPANHSAGTSSLYRGNGDVCYPRPIMTGRAC